MEKNRPRVAIAGTSGYIAASLRETLVDRFDLIILTRSQARSGLKDSGGRVEWRQYDHFSRKEVEASLRGADYAVYLVHNRDPSARLDQALARDRDVLVADNFARGASRAGVKQIMYRTQQVCGPSARHEGSEAAEVIRVLSSHGVPVTVLRTGLVIATGGEIMRLLVRLVKRMPVIPLPQLARTAISPLTLSDLMTAFGYCIGNPETFGRSYDISGTERMSMQDMIEFSAAVLGRSPRFFPAPLLPESAFALLLRVVHGSLHPEFLAYLLDSLRNENPTEDSPVQDAIARHGVPIATVMEPCIRTADQGIVETRQQRRRERDDDILRVNGRVRSIQRLRLPAGKNAEWMAAYYFSWLGSRLRLFLSTERAADGSWDIRSGRVPVVLLSLTFQPLHSSPDRQLFYITGGILARFLGGRTARLEFRDVLDRQFTIAAIHDFSPSLPWLFYRFTHAIIHGMVMKSFQRHMASLVGASIAPQTSPPPSF